MDGITSNVREETRLNVDLPLDLKRKLKIYCVNNDMYIKDVVEMSLEFFFEEMEKKHSG